ncbi:MAG: four helix bundle protein [Duncaniella sp.]|nr:four helix bundle protein [Duncaniella sp.]
MGRRGDNVVLVKSKDFAVRIVMRYQYLWTEKAEHVLSKQLLRCGTSIGANLNEAQEAVSPKEFETKVYIALKEARETEYWLELLHKTDYLSKSQYDSINTDCVEILKLLVSITKSLRSK